MSTGMRVDRCDDLKPVSGRDESYVGSDTDLVHCCCSSRSLRFEIEQNRTLQNPYEVSVMDRLVVPQRQGCAYQRFIMGEG